MFAIAKNAPLHTPRYNHAIMVSQQGLQDEQHSCCCLLLRSCAAELCWCNYLVYMQPSQVL
jgi:hypothetical protein